MCRKMGHLTGGHLTGGHLTGGLNSAWCPDVLYETRVCEVGHTDITPLLLPALHLHTLVYTHDSDSLIKGVVVNFHRATA